MFIKIDHDLDHQVVGEEIPATSFLMEEISVDLVVP